MSDKIYPASPRKRRKAREDGQVAKSTELISLLTLFGVLLTVYFGKHSLFSLIESFLILLRQNISQEFTPNILTIYIQNMLRILSPIFVIAILIAIISNYQQVGLMFSPKSIQPKLGKLNPINGFKKMFSLDSIVELTKSVLKVIGVILIAYESVESMIISMPSQYTDDPFKAFNNIFDNVLSIILKVVLFLLILAILDYIYKKFKFEKDLKMTRQEMMDEFKQMEGNPQIKQKQKEFGRMLTKKQISSVKDATVLITNPTHFAIAIKYDSVTHPVPFVLFKGVDDVAQAAKKIAKENNICMVENRPLARALYAKSKEGEFIPQDMFDAVAKVITYVYKINNKL